MNLLKNYPLSSPEGTYYLPSTLERDRASVIDMYSHGFVIDTRKIAKNYLPTNYFSKESMAGIADNIKKYSVTKWERFPNSSVLNSCKKILEEDLNKFLQYKQESTPSCQFYSDLEHLLFKWLEKCTLLNPHIYLQKEFMLELQDFLVVKQYCQAADYAKYRLQKRVAVCYDFAFYQLNEDKAFPCIFDEKALKWPVELMWDTDNFLKVWGYQKTTTPVAGDLVAYCSTLKKGTPLIKHWGIWTQNGTVLSKFGSGSVYEHPIEDVAIAYGNYVCFFHKPLKSLLMQDFLGLLDNASQAIESFSYDACRSPLTPSGCCWKVMQIFGNTRVQRVFKNSIYNVAYNEKLRGCLLLAMQQSTPDKANKAAVIEEARNLIWKTVKSVAWKIPLQATNKTGV